MLRGSRVDNALDEVVVLGNEILTVVHNEYTAGIEFDMMLLRFLDSKRLKGALQIENEFLKKCDVTFGYTNRLGMKKI